MQKAESLYQRALTLGQKRLGENSPAVAFGLQHLALINRSMGNFARAESYYQRSLNILELNQNQQTNIATTLTLLASIYNLMKDFPKAEAALNRARGTYEQVLGPKSVEVAMIISKLAQLYEGMGNAAKAEAHYRQAVEILEARLGRGHPDVAFMLLSLGGVAYKIGDLADAQGCDERARGILETNFGMESFILAPCLNNLGAVYIKMGKLADAEPLLKRALRINEKFLDADHPEIFKALRNLCLLYLAEHDDARALETARKAEENRLKLLANVVSYAPEVPRLGYYARDNPYGLFAVLDNPRELMQATLRTKGVILDSFLEDRLVMEASAKPDVRALAEELLPIKRRLAQLTLRTPADPRSEVLSRRSEMRWHLEHKADELEIDLTHKVPGIDKARRAIDISPEEVQCAIPKDAALIRILPLFPPYLGIDAAELRYGAVILPSSGEPKWVCLGPVKPIDQNIWLAHACVHAATNENALAKCLGDLYRQVWAPVTPLLPDGLKTIIISPDAGLNFPPASPLC